jgi:hypothetical protein
MVKKRDLSGSSISQTFKKNPNPLQESGKINYEWTNISMVILCSRSLSQRKENVYLWHRDLWRLVGLSNLPSIPFCTSDSMVTNGDHPDRYFHRVSTFFTFPLLTSVTTHCHRHTPHTSLSFSCSQYDSGLCLNFLMGDVSQTSVWEGTCISTN